jgi:hypothetical protein
MLSVTMAFTVADPPEPSEKDVVDDGLPTTESEIVCTRQVVNCTG